MRSAIEYWRVMGMQRLPGLKKKLVAVVLPCAELLQVSRGVDLLDWKCTFEFE